MKTGSPETSALLEPLFTYSLKEWKVIPPLEAREKLAWFLDELLRWNRRIRLTGHRRADQAALDLVLDSLALCPFIKGDRLLDIGSGPGVPGLVLALALPGLNVTMVEGKAKKVSFQRHVIRELELGDRVAALNTRAGEDLSIPRNFHTVTMRAVGGLEWSLALARRHLVRDPAIPARLEAAAISDGGLSTGEHAGPYGIEGRPGVGKDRGAEAREGGASLHPDTRPDQSGVVLLPRGLADREEALALGLRVAKYRLPGVSKERCIVMLGA